MKLLIDRWCDCSPLARCLCWLAMLIVMAVACALVRQPESEKVPETALTAQWRKLLSMRGEPLPPFIPVSRPFSATAFQPGESQLVSWQPQGAGGELVLDASWESIVPAFGLLAEQGMSVKAFSIAPAKQRLQMTLQLEANGEG